jgi:hypothetical protein
MSNDLPPPPPPHSQGGIVVETKIFPLAFLLLLTRPQLSVDGGPIARVSWGQATFALPPGRHTVRCFVPYLWYRHMGDATIEVDVPPVGVVTVRWKSPWLVFFPGKWKIV